MGKQGPCCHCGVTSTPLWRNGPSSKPVLCNACGSRWRTKGSLQNYTPLHARGHTFAYVENNKSGEGRLFRETNTDGLHVTGGPEHNLESATEISRSDTCSGSTEKDTGSRSTSESGISYSVSYAPLDNTDGIENTGSVQSRALDSPLPSKKRTALKGKSLSPVEKLQKELYDILCEQDSSSLSELSEEVLLFHSPTSAGSIEIGLGSVLIKHIHSIAEESERSSTSENKHHEKGESCSGLSSSYSHSFGAMSSIGEEG